VACSRKSSSENKNADSSPDHYSDFPTPNTYRGRHAKFDVARECQFESGSKEEQSRCATEETQARDQLRTEWTQFTAGQKTQCNQETSAGGFFSYVELQTCLGMEREVNQERDAKNTLK